MPQTTSALSARNAKVELSTNGTVWTDISGHANKVEPSESTRQTGETYTFDGDTAIITSGKREPLEIEVAVVYTENSGEAFELVRAAHENASALYVRYSPKGGTTGNYQFTSDVGIAATFNYPMVDATEASPIVIAFTLKTAKVTKAAAA